MSRSHCSHITQPPGRWWWGSSVSGGRMRLLFTTPRAAVAIAIAVWTLSGRCMHSDVYSLQQPSELARKEPASQGCSGEWGTRTRPHAFPTVTLTHAFPQPAWPAGFLVMPTFQEETRAGGLTKPRADKGLRQGPRRQLQPHLSFGVSGRVCRLCMHGCVERRNVP